MDTDYGLRYAAARLKAVFAVRRGCYFIGRDGGSVYLEGCFLCLRISFLCSCVVMVSMYVAVLVFV